MFLCVKSGIQERFEGTLDQACNERGVEDVVGRFGRILNDMLVVIFGPGRHPEESLAEYPLECFGSRWVVDLTHMELFFNILVL